MKAIKFDCKGHNAPAYGCSEPGDQSGEYVRVDGAETINVEWIVQKRPLSGDEFYDSPYLFYEKHKAIGYLKGCVSESMDADNYEYRIVRRKIVEFEFVEDI